MGEAAHVWKGEDGDFAFMDGPFGFRARGDEGGVRVLLEDRHSDPPSVIAEGVVALEAFRGAITSAATAAVAACDEHGWPSCDVDRLRSDITEATAQQQVEADKARER
jgi:hypothetical protein